MNRLMRILIVHSGKELFRYKSFFLLIFVLILLDRFLKKVVHVDKSALTPSGLKEISVQSARFVFDVLPGELVAFLSDYRTLLVLVGLFFLKELISMWPSSDMRRMHRRERDAFGLIGSLLALRWDQVLWDAIAVSTICGVTGVWAAAHFAVFRAVWNAYPTPWCLLGFGVAVSLFLPITMAGFSFSSKLAVLSQGRFGEKLTLFFGLFTDPRIRWPAWLFFLARIAIESLFVVLLPLLVIVMVDVFWLRILMASLLATPVYSYLKMASFKFFLEVYRPFALVRREYRQYYTSIDA